MSRWFGFGSSGDVDTLFGSDFYRCLLGRCQDGLVWFLGRCWLCPAGDFYTNGLVLVPREMSGWFGLSDSGDVNMVRF